VRDNVLFTHAIDPDTRMLTGRAVKLETNVGVSSAGRGLFTASPRLLLAAPAATRARELAWLDEHGTRLGASGEPGDYWQVRLSPDDQYAAVTQLAPLLHTLDVWVRPVAREGLPEQLTLAVAADSDPVWSNDGRRVLFRSLQSGTANLFTHAVHDKDAGDELFMKSELDETPTDWSGTTVLFQAPRAGSGLDIWRFDSDANAVEGVATNPFNEWDARWSPDGGWIAYVSDESGRPDVYVQPWPEGDRVRVSLAGGSRPRWSRDGDTLYFIRGDQMMRADVQDSGEMPFATPRPMFDVPGLRDFDVAHRTNRFLVLLPVKGTGGASVTATMDWEGGP
jgi:dipeptidyl aminopeptidase/acylaminoacyl peptidase